jgi:U2-associated protein SR140
MSQYTTGTVRKTRREKEKELAEAKQKEEEERAAQAYAEFLDEFEGEGSTRPKTSQFVKAGQAEPAHAPPSRPTAPRAHRFERNVSPLHVLYIQSSIAV